MISTNIIYHNASVTRKSPAAHAIVNESDGLFNKYIDQDAYQKHVYNKENLLNDWFVVKNNS